MNKQNNKSEIEKPLMKPKLLWKGTTGEAIKEGRLTQEQVDEWNMKDSEGERYIEGFQSGILKAKDDFIKMLDKLEKRIAESYGNNKDLELKHLLVLQNNLPIYFKELKQKISKEIKNENDYEKSL